MSNKYAEMKNRQHNEVHQIDIGFAFSDEQFYEMMHRWNLDPDEDLDKILRLPYGGFIQKKDSQKLRDTMDRHQKELSDAIADDLTGEGFIFDMFLYELDNHEYGYTGDTTDALEALGFTAQEVVDDPRLNRGICKAHQVIMGRED